LAASAIGIVRLQSGHRRFPGASGNITLQ